MKVKRTKCVDLLNLCEQSDDLQSLICNLPGTSLLMLWIVPLASLALQYIISEIVTSHLIPLCKGNPCRSVISDSIWSLLENLFAQHLRSVLQELTTDDTSIISAVDERKQSGWVSHPSWFTYCQVYCKLWEWMARKKWWIHLRSPFFDCVKFGLSGLRELKTPFSAL